MKEFKSKRIKSKKKRKFRLIIFTFFFFFSYVYMFKYLKKNELEKNILKEDINYINFNVKDEGFKIIDWVINNPVNLLNSNVRNVKVSKLKKENTTFYNKKENSVIKENEVDKENPIVYVYNTHQSEDYDGYTIYDASKILVDKLNSAGISTYFEEQSIKVFLDNNNLKYYKSYTASRKYMLDAKQKYVNMKYFFDIHRDSVSKNISTITYDGKDYAKVLFVVGTDNSSYENNKNSADKLNKIIENKVPNISRGIALHGGKEYNGVYNQDVSDNVFLIEIGGKDNTKQEVENTINIIYESILEYIRGVI